MLIQAVLPLFAEGAFDLVFRKYAESLPFMTLFDVFNDIVQILLVVIFTREKNEISWSIFFVHVFGIDLAMKNDSTLSNSSTCLPV